MISYRFIMNLHQRSIPQVRHNKEHQCLHDIVFLPIIL